MSLGTAIAGALPGMRAEAESMMTDCCVVRDPSAASRTWDEATGAYTMGTAPVVYSGKCLVREASPSPSGSAAGEAAWTVRRVIVHLPVKGSKAVRQGHTVTVTQCPNDSAMVGLTATVAAFHAQTNSTARRLPCEVVTRDE